MKKLIVKFLIRLLCAKDVLFAESFTLKAVYKDCEYKVNFSDEEIENILSGEETVSDDINDTRKKKLKNKKR